MAVVIGTTAFSFSYYFTILPSLLPMRLNNSFVMLPASSATTGAAISFPPSYPISVAVIPASTFAISVTSTAS